MDPNQQQLLLTSGGGGDDNTYVDDVFSAYTYYGNSSAGHVINNGIDLAGEGGFVWIKKRSGTDNHVATHVPGTVLFPNLTNAASTGNTGFISSFNSNGFTLGGGVSGSNASGETAISWTWRKAPGFFDVVTYTGNGAAGRQVPHNLGSKPGVMMVKCTSSAGEPWYVYHKDLGATKHLKLNESNAAGTNTEPWNNTEPTSTHFTLAQYNSSNGSGKTYVAYLFAGGESTAATARSVEMDGSGDYLSVGSSSDFTMGTGDFTIECWARFNDSSNRGVFQISDQSGGLSSSGGGGGGGTIAFSHNGSAWHIYGAASSHNCSFTRTVGQWYHIAYTRTSGVSRCFVNGVQIQEFSDTHNYNGTYIAIGGYYTTSYLMNGDISNFRVIKGTSLYATSFTPPYTPLTNVTNTKLLCCNNVSVTGSTTTSATISSNGNPQPTTDSPFDDPEGLKFGKDGDQPLIKCGSYTGASSHSTQVDIEIGWEPQWIFIKDTSTTKDWVLLDTTRWWYGNYGGSSGVNVKWLSSNDTDGESGGTMGFVRSNGFSVGNSSFVNGSNNNFVYMAIRMSDGYVGKPAEAGTDVFAMDYGSGSTTIPSYDSPFRVDFGLEKRPASNISWWHSTRKTGGTYVRPDTAAAQSGPNTDYAWDSNVGYVAASWANSDTLAYMWKRGAGIDVLSYQGISRNVDIPHSLGKTPEMYWIKKRNASEDWAVYHVGMNGGNSPEGWLMKLNGSNAQDNAGGSFWFAPTSTHLRLKSGGSINFNGNDYVATLFTSVPGISKCGFYNGSSSPQTITTGFQPRFFFCKRWNSTGNWTVFDTTRGWGSGNDCKYELNTDGPQNCNSDFGYPTSSGIYLTVDGDVNQNNYNFIYYAHA